MLQTQKKKSRKKSAQASKKEGNKPGSEIGGSWSGEVWWVVLDWKQPMTVCYIPNKKTQRD